MTELSPSNDLLYQPPPYAAPMQLSVGLVDPVHATVDSDGLIRSETVAIQAASDGWIIALCTALVASGVSPERSIILRMWDRTPLATVLSIGDTLATQDLNQTKVRP